MKRRQRLRAVLASLFALLVLRLPASHALAREVETDGMTSGTGGVGPISVPASAPGDGLGWWWIAVVAGILVGGALILAIADHVRRRPPRLPRAHPA